MDFFLISVDVSIYILPSNHTSIQSGIYFLNLIFLIYTIQWGLKKTPLSIQKKMIDCLWVFRSTREFFTDMVTSLLPVKGCKF